mgnify:CR=1 FL=1
MSTMILILGLDSDIASKELVSERHLKDSGRSTTQEPSKTSKWHSLIVALTNQRQAAVMM